MTDPNLNHLCPGCFVDKGSQNPCPHCGYDEATPRGPLVLPHRSLLNGQFLIGRVLGKPGGFGITYLAWDQQLHTRVAIKEYLPRDLAGRGVDQSTAAAHSGEDAELFRFGLEQFLQEARTLAQLDHPNIVRVRQFFEANGTAYLVMDYYEGVSFAEYLEQYGGRLTEATATQLLLPILDGLRAVHAKGFLHRDVKPQNIYLAKTDTGGVRPILLDFGAARQAMGERSRSLSVVVSAGYAPFEQYHRKGKQGPWTDVYAAAAVLYRAVTGETPAEANERVAEDDLKPASVFGVSPTLSAALSAALALAPEARPQSVPAFQAQLRGEPRSAPASRDSLTATDPALAGTSSTPSAESPRSAKAAPHPSRGPRWWLIPILGLPLLALLGVGIWWSEQSRIVSPPDNASTAEPVARRALPPAPPAPPVAPAAPQGYLQVSISGAAAEVTVDGRRVGRAGPGEPLNLGQGLAVGEVEVGVSAAGYHAQQRRLRIRENAWTQVQFHLAAEPSPRLAFEPELVAIEGGCFQMGSPASEAERDDDERQHRVCVEDFAIGRYEVTQAQWEAVMGSNPSGFAGCANCPVEQVSWNDVQDYLDKLNARTGNRYRLPTEAEWEYAARAGTTTPFWSGGCINTEQANYNGEYDYDDCGAKTGVYRQKKTLPVGSLQANPWGLYDVAGNVYEWTCSVYDSGYGGAEQRCARKNDAGSRALRGGSWDDKPLRVRSANRNRTTAVTRDDSIGFRLAQDSL
ncbi:SUMF1/EgtB/PvdO family nonheme iron enzyme [Thiohalocapsa marina]|uniref:SUMF1/EgtB/PvdO family nonheme iron enzyme n=1 Tax=Thiohalocapsa marina TaxID=424902 RepID=A0A5M8FJ42_9GAMM|nr:bifunctional serine/threonine-protein kinase/formylglycine-generating enzyme family protein [Thiohalocapsa marina]KAA6182485.1 SUMF1/EgtB/PvdO family nonheme iron enzyme [Thiohalocapsa marina]